MATKTRKCVICLEEQDKEEFRKSQNRLFKECKTCRDAITTRRCTQCDQDKDPNEFIRNAKSFYKTCKDCRTTTKKCSECLEEKTIDDFRTGPRSISSKCATCRAKPKSSKVKTKLCVACSEEKDAECFLTPNQKRYTNMCLDCRTNKKTFLKKCQTCGIEKQSPTEIEPTAAKCRACKVPIIECRACKKELLKKFFRRNQVICKECEANDDITYMKKCNVCGEEKESTCFRKNRLKCTDCERANGRNYRRTTTKAKEWADNNQEKMSELRDKWYQENKEKIRASERDRYKNDPQYKFVKSYRITVCDLIRGNTKVNKAVDMKYSNFRKWLEFCFTNEMTWDNRVETWQVDHVIPIDYIFNNDTIKNNDAKSSILAWYNIMPVLKKHNLKKNKYLDKEQLIQHLKTLDAFLRKYPSYREHTLKKESYITYRKVAQELLDQY